MSNITVDCPSPVNNLNDIYGVRRFDLPEVVEADRTHPHWEGSAEGDPNYVLSMARKQEINTQNTHWLTKRM